ncbi:TldD/PmbA family protein [Candidatus Atribacteria bacterium HGW-Atribacteria-1]|nr:MAG: TldD/PmbA family protein [Candidatus Atribacteria bacterium HGW-Atribacteria-1]
MEKLLEMAGKICDKAEVYSIDHTYNSVTFEDAKLHDIESKFQSGISLRIIKNGKLGFAYTKNLLNCEEILQNAIDSIKGEVEANYDFPLTKELPQLNTYDPSIENLISSEMVRECTRICDILKSKTDGEISITSYKHIKNIRIINSEGIDISKKSSLYGIYGGVIYPGSISGIWRFLLSKKFQKLPVNVLNEIIELYTLSSNVIKPEGGKMKVMFMPNSMITLNWRIFSGTSSKSIYERISPIANKIGEKIFDEKITIFDDSLDDRYPSARAFDDEGVKCKPLTIIEDGVLKSFYYDLNYASKLNTESTGHGYKTAQWGGDLITSKPMPVLTHMRIKPGKKSLSDLVKLIDRGLILEGALGPHSGNIPNGDYSVGVNPGLYVENGEIIGHVKDAMVAGNIYETLKHVIDISDTLYPSYTGQYNTWMPAILFDNLSVATKY